jgi:hypothetical protein
MLEPWFIQIIVQFPIVGLFIWYNERALARAERDRNQLIERTEKERENIENRWRTWIEFQDKRRAEERDSLHSRMVEEFTDVTKALEKVVDSARK